jgi:hypothetical protein
MIQTIWAFIKPHVAYWAIGLTAYMGIHSWLAEHDARLKADIQVKDAQVLIDGLKVQISTRQVQTQKEVQVIIKEVAAAKTPVQQVAEVEKLSPALKPVELPDAPSSVKVNLPALVQSLGQCKVDSMKLSSCQKDLAAHEAIEAQQNKQVEVLKKRPGFFKRLTQDRTTLMLGGILGAGVTLYLEHR